MTNKRIKMPFGKYRGRAFPNIPSDYLEWLLSLDDISRDIKDEAMTVLFERKVFAESFKKKKGKK